MLVWIFFLLFSPASSHRVKNSLCSQGYLNWCARKKILLLVFLFAFFPPPLIFTLLGVSVSHFIIALKNGHVVPPTKFLVLSFSVVHVSVDIKIYSKKRLDFVVVFSLISPFPSYLYSFILLLTSIVHTSIWFKITLARRGDPVRVKVGMSLRNGMWHGLRNDIIMQNLVYRKWRKEINLTGKHLRISAAPFRGANLREHTDTW